MSYCVDQSTKDKLVTAVVRIVDDDDAVRASLADLLRSADISAVAYETPYALLSNDDLSTPGCIVIDVRLSDASGLDFLSELRSAGHRVPIIIMSGYPDISLAESAVAAGAYDFLVKPFQDQELIDVVSNAIVYDREKAAVGTNLNR